MSKSEISAAAYSTIQETQLKYWEKIRHPFVAGLELTPKCNMRCIHCYMKEYDAKETLTKEQWKNIIDKLYESGVLILYMTGGEILTREDFADIYVHAKKRGFIIELLTNGTCLTQELIEVFDRYPPATVSISVYGMSASTYEAVTGVRGSFSRFMKSVEMLKAADIDIELKFIGLKENFSDLDRARDFAEKIGAKFKFNFEIFPTLSSDVSVLEHRLTNEQILEIEKNTPSAARVWANNVYGVNPFLDREIIPLYTCNVASTLLYIDCKGFVSPCNKMRLKTHNILCEELGDIWKIYIEEFSQKIAPSDYKCAKCRYIHICSPCPVINQLSTGDCLRPDTAYCRLAEMRKKEFSKAKYDIYRNNSKEVE